MSQSARKAAISDDADRMGKIAKPMGVEGERNHAQGDYSGTQCLKAGVSALNKQIARGASAPTVGGRKMTDY